MSESWDDLIAKFARTIDEHGHGVIGVFPTEDDADKSYFSYSYGLAAQDRPELLVTMLPSEVAARVINNAAAQPITGPGDYADVLQDYDVRAVPVGAEGRKLMSVSGVFAPHFQALQLLWPDPDGRFPGDDGYDAQRWAQPVYGDGRP